MPRELDANTIQALLVSGDFEAFKGTFEIQGMECKSIPYRLSENYQKQELAKDVSGMANAAGGFILLGILTEIDPTRAEETINEIRHFSQDLFDPQQYRDTLKSWVYPPLENIEISWWPSAGDQTKGIAALHVPPQPKDKQPFLVTRTITESGKTSEIVFGHFERRRTSVDATSVARLHSQIQAGMKSNYEHPQLQAIQDMLGQLIARADAAPEPANPISEKEIEERVSQALIGAELNDVPAFTLSVRPLKPTNIPTLFRSRQEEVVKVLDSPPTFRPGGFHLTSGQQQTQIAGSRRRVTEAKSHQLELWRDGTLLIVLRGDESFLCWATKTKHLTVNPITLIESVFEFVELSRTVYQYADPSPIEVDYTVSLRRMNKPEGPARMGQRESYGFYGSVGNAAPDSDMQNVLPANLSEEPVGAIVFKIVAAVYECFGLEHDYIPLRERKPSSTEKLDAIDLALLKSIK